MRIIKLGKIVSGFEGLWKCPHCKTEWEMDGTENPPPKLQSNTIKHENWFEIKCPNPECKRNVTRDKRK